MNCQPLKGARLRHAGWVCLLALAALDCDRSGGLSHFEQVKLTQNEAAEAIEEKGGTAVENRYPQGDAWVVDLSGLTIDDELIRHVKTLRQVAELNLSGSTITDEQMAALAEPTPLGTMVKLDISDTQVSDAGLMALAKLHLLFEINVKGSRVSSDGIDRYRNERPKHPFGLALKVTK